MSRRATAAWKARNAAPEPVPAPEPDAAAEEPETAQEEAEG